MAPRRKVTPDDIERMNELYAQNKNYSATARETGFSASTVKKYIIPNYTSRGEIKLQKVTLEDVPEFSTWLFDSTPIENWGELCEQSPEEVEEIKELWKELTV